MVRKSRRYDNSIRDQIIDECTDSELRKRLLEEQLILEEKNSPSDGSN